MFTKNDLKELGVMLLFTLALTGCAILGIDVSNPIMVLLIMSAICLVGVVIPNWKKILEASDMVVFGEEKAKKIQANRNEKRVVDR